MGGRPPEHEFMTFRDMFDELKADELAELKAQVEGLEGYAAQESVRADALEMRLERALARLAEHGISTDGI